MRGGVDYLFFFFFFPVGWAVYSMRSRYVLMEIRSPPFPIPLCFFTLATVKLKRGLSRAHNCKQSACLAQEVFNKATLQRLTVCLSQRSTRSTPYCHYLSCYKEKAGLFFCILSGSVYCSCTKPSDTYCYKWPYFFEAIHHFHKWNSSSSYDRYFLPVLT